MSLSRLLPVVSLSSIFVLGVGSVFAKNGKDNTASPHHPSSLSCLTDVSTMSKKQKLAHLFSPRSVPALHATGTGFLVDSEGHIATNHHVVKGANSISVMVHDDGKRNSLGQKFTAILVGKDKRTDLAVLKIETENSFPCVQFADSNVAYPDDNVSAIGHPHKQYFTLTRGVISSVNRNLKSFKINDVIQTDLAINSGNSGGPLFSDKGKVVGVNAVIYSARGGSIGISYAIPSNTVRDVVGELILRGNIQDGTLGVSTEDLQNSEGARITGVYVEGASALAGIEVADVIVAVDGKKVSVVNDLARAIARSDPGEKMNLSVRRSGKIIDVPVILGSPKTVVSEVKVTKKTNLANTAKLTP